MVGLSAEKELQLVMGIRNSTLPKKLNTRKEGLRIASGGYTIALYY